MCVVLWRAFKDFTVALRCVLCCGVPSRWFEGCCCCGVPCAVASRRIVRSVVRCVVLWCDVIRCDVMWCVVLWCVVVWCGVVWRGAI